MSRSQPKIWQKSKKLAVIISTTSLVFSMYGFGGWGRWWIKCRMSSLECQVSNVGSQKSKVDNQKSKKSPKYIFWFKSWQVLLLFCCWRWWSRGWRGERWWSELWWRWRWFVPLKDRCLAEISIHRILAQGLYWIGQRIMMSMQNIQMSTNVLYFTHWDYWSIFEVFLRSIPHICQLKPQPAYV